MPVGSVQKKKSHNALKSKKKKTPLKKLTLFADSYLLERQFLVYSKGLNLSTANKAQHITILRLIKSLDVKYHLETWRIFGNSVFPSVITECVLLRQDLHLGKTSFVQVVSEERFYQ